MARSDDTTTDGASEAVADVYDALAPIYDAMGGARPFAMLVVERLEELIATRRSQLRAREETAPASMFAAEAALVSGAVSFLDLGCGTGTLLLALRALHPGWRLCGVDVSPGMLAVAGRKPGHESVLWTRARLPAPLPFTERFDVVGAFYDTLNHLPDRDALAATFRTVSSVLRRGGLFVFDLNNAFGFETWWQYRVSLDSRGAPPRHGARLRRPRPDGARGDRSAERGPRTAVRAQGALFLRARGRGGAGRGRSGSGDHGPLVSGQSQQPKQNVVCRGEQTVNPNQTPRAPR